MTSYELLNPRDHAQLRVRPPQTTPHFVQVLAPEFIAAAACCPVLFTKEDDTGKFYAGAMFGFKPGETLLNSVDDREGFQPLMLLRDGFFISDKNIAIDRQHERFSDSDGEPLFDEAQQPGKALRTIQQVLGQIHSGIEVTGAFIAALQELSLIEPIEVSLAFDGGERLSLRGLYGVSLDRLREVDDAAALKLFRAGHLQLAYVMAGSLKQIGRLARLRNRRK